MMKDYFVIPVARGEKRPSIRAWQETRMTYDELERRFPDANVGVLCGVGDYPIAAIDIDVLDEALAVQFRDWCFTHLGAAPERIGRAPKRLLVYRAAEAGWKKSVSGALDGQRVEVLGAGQQFVAFGLHPDTHAPYRWTGKDLHDVPASSLPVITREQVADAIRAFEKMAGIEPHAAPEVADEDFADPPVGLTLDKARELITGIDNVCYDTWLNVGMALHHEFGGAPEAMALWNEWSSTAPNYAGREDIEKRWASFGRVGGRKLTARWILKQAKRSALEEARALIEACTDHNELVRSVARKVGAMLTDKVDIEDAAAMIKARRKALGGPATSVATIREVMKGGGRPLITMSQGSNVDRMQEKYGDIFRFAADTNTWYMWDGVRWKPKTAADVAQLAQDVVRELVKDAEGIEDDGAFANFVRTSDAAAMFRGMVEILSSRRGVLTTSDEFGKQTRFLTAQNGLVDLQTGALLPPDQDALDNRVAGTYYDPSATCPLFERTVLDAFWGDAEMARFFQKVIGYSILGDLSEQFIVMSYGHGANGKSTIYEAINGALGEYADTANAATFTKETFEQSGGAPREDIVRLRGLRLVYVSEMSENVVLGDELIKKITDKRSKIVARTQRALSSTTYNPSFVLHIATNHRPIVKGDDFAIWRRIMPIEFTRNFLNDPFIKADRRLPAKLEAERAGILAWIVRGALAYQNEGLDVPEKVLKAREEYRADMDLLSGWLEDCCELEPGAMESIANLWASWQRWATQNGGLNYVHNNKALARKLRAKGLVDHKGTGGARMLIGIKLVR